MNADQFLTNFGYVAMAPSGVKRLRELLLHLAVSGRLVPRKSGEGEGDATIAEAATLKDAYRTKHELRPGGSDKPLSETEIDFAIPSYWKWERLGNIACYIQRGKGPKYDAAGKTLVISQKCIQWSGFDLSSARRISDDSVKDYTHERFLVNGDILWNSTGTGTAGRIALYPGAKEQVVADSHVTIIRLTNFVPAYVWSYLASPTIQQRMIPGQESSMVTGTTNQVELSATKVSELPIPCPPLAEQKRIVAKVDELMALCDELEAQQKERERRFPVLSRTCHARFAEAPTPANLDRIFDEIDSISPDDLRTTILTLAVQGKLLAQDLDDEPVEVLLARNDSHRQETAREDRRADQQNQLLLSSEDRWAIASTWEWRGLADLVLFVDYRGKTPTKISDGVRLLTAKNVKKGEINLTPEEFLSEADYQKWMTRGFPKPGDVLFTTEAPMGNAAVVRLNERFALAQRVICFQSYGAVEPPFLVMQILSDGFQLILDKNGTGVTAKGIKASKLKRLPIAVPPLAEQRRIVAKVDELMALVNQLEAYQQERDKLAEAFAKACVASITGTTQLERPEKMKAPKTELVSRVTLGKKPKPDTKAPLARLLIQNKGTLPAKSLWQQSGLTIDTFYQQLKTELAQGWIAPPAQAEMKILEED